MQIAGSGIEVLRSVYARNLFQNKVVLVTGGSRGIGRSMCLAFGALGAKVLINYAGNEKAASDTAKDVCELGGTAHVFQCDVSQFDRVQETFKSLEETHKSIDILVNNAGVARDGLFVRMKESDWDLNLDTNLKGAFNCTRAAATGMMRRRSGKIINVSSVIGLLGNGGQVAYAASKAGLIGMTKSLAREFGTRNMQINAIAPGYISTDMTENQGEKLIESVLQQIPMGRLGKAEEVAHLAVFLASSASAYITGQTFAVDGGMTMV